VISGDTNPTQATIDACRGCDVLIHEVHTAAWLAARPEAGRPHPFEGAVFGIPLAFSSGRSDFHAAG
jgi:ribonuclease BN (tRNA processing enzyme)